ncbi:hypothetical protein [Streptomyces europaeiscabiei]|uniref:hypothetical protein n=1 Tax=Streptomyces europaeiscabiei TaxID=146819 RepID=UPI0038F6801B
MATTPNPAPDTLWQNLTDALNALVAAGRFPAFHNLYGTDNNWQHQPYVTSSHANAPRVVYDLTTGTYTVTTRERTLNGEHTRRKRRSRR